MLGEKLKKLRKELNITQEELARNIGVTTSMVGMYETNARKPSYEVLLKIADCFNVSTDYLLGKTSIKRYEYIERRLNSPLSHSLLDEEFLEKLAESKDISIDSAENLMKQVLKNNLIDFFTLDIREWDLIDRIKEEMLSNPKSVEENISQTYFDIILETYEWSKYKTEYFIPMLKKFKEIIDSYPTFLDKAKKYPKKKKIIDEILEFYIQPPKTLKSIQKPNTIAAHLPEGVELTEEEKEKVNDYIQFLLSKRKK